LHYLKISFNNAKKKRKKNAKKSNRAKFITVQQPKQLRVQKNGAAGAKTAHSRISNAVHYPQCFALHPASASRKPLHFMQNHVAWAFIARLESLHCVTHPCSPVINPSTTNRDTAYVKH
jgi:hypothetical protein